MLYIYINAGLVCTGQEAWCTSCLLAQKTRQIPERKKIKGKEKKSSKVS